MHSSKTSAPAVSRPTLLTETPAGVLSHAAARRPWYPWLCTLSAALVGLYYLPYLAITPATNGPAFVWLAAIVACSFAGAAGFALNRKWGAQLLLVACLLLLPRIAFNAYSVYTILSAGYSSGFAIRLMGSLIILAFSAYSSALAWLTFAAMWRHSQRLAWAVLFLLGVPFLLALAIIPTTFLAVR